nr:carboxymuconolactone decarboxylase family protein [Sphingomonas sp. CCH5-D11]
MRSFLPLLLAAALPTSVLAQSAPPPRSVAPATMKRWAPALAGDTDRVLFGDVWRRAELSPRDRSMVTVSVLIATGRTAQLEGHLGRALDNGVRPSEVAGLVTHLAWYTGWPNAVSSLQVVDRVMGGRGVDPSAVQSDGTPVGLPSTDPARARGVSDTIAPTAPKLAQLTNDVLFADVWRRSDLAPRDRSLATIAALAANGDADQLAFHVTRGLENGLTRAEIAEAMTHLAFYAGWPKAMAAIAVLAKTNGAREAVAEPLVIVPPGGSPQKGPAERFTGTVTVTSPFRSSGDARLGGATVTFRPGARSNWHSHPLGQLLVVTDGEGRIQVEGGDMRAIRAGDTVWTAPNVRHWHGASPDRAMTHVAISENMAGQDVSWGEPVTEAQYRGLPASPSER